MKKKLLFAVFLLSGLFLGISAQEHWIEGFYERHGDNQYTLKQINTKGIFLDGQTTHSPISGEKARITCNGLKATMVQFSFDRATTICPTKWNGGFTFQFWDDEKENWRTDVEACRNFEMDYSQNDMVIMLVLDYSSSMSANIKRMKTSAIKFINSVSSTSTGNVHVGIIAFSGMDLAKEQVLPITPLTKDNRHKFVDFINDAEKGMETALYFSMDKAIGMMEDYVKNKKFSNSKFNGTCMITFTDGLDNASINDKISVSMHRGRKNEYLRYLSGKLSGPNRKTIQGLPVESFAIGFTGSENFTNDDLAFFEDVLQQTTPDKDHFKLAREFDEVEAYFDTITKNLTDRWEILNMYVGESQHGRIRWVLQCEEPIQAPIETPKPKPPITSDIPSPWFGICGEACIDGDDILWGGTIEAAWSINDKLAIGGRFGVISNTDLDAYYLIGPELKYTFPKGNAIIAGLGMATGDGVFWIRGGYKFESPWYIAADIFMADGASVTGICVGYSFGGK